MNGEELAKANKAIRNGKFGTAHQYGLLKELERVQSQRDRLLEGLQPAAEASKHASAIRLTRPDLAMTDKVYAIHHLPRGFCERAAQLVTDIEREKL